MKTIIILIALSFSTLSAQLEENPFFDPIDNAINHILSENQKEKAHERRLELLQKQQSQNNYGLINCEICNGNGSYYTHNYDGHYISEEKTKAALTLSKRFKEDSTRYTPKERQLIKNWEAILLAMKVPCIICDGEGFLIEVDNGDYKSLFSFNEFKQLISKQHH